MNQFDRVKTQDVGKHLLYNQNAKKGVAVEQLTTKCNILSNGAIVLDNLNVSITIKLDLKTQMKQWDGMLYLTGNESRIFYISKGQTFEIELMDGRKGKFYAAQPGHTVSIKGLGPLE